MYNQFLCFYVKDLCLKLRFCENQRINNFFQKVFSLFFSSKTILWNFSGKIFSRVSSQNNSKNFLDSEELVFFQVYLMLSIIWSSSNKTSSKRLHFKFYWQIYSYYSKNDFSTDFSLSSTFPRPVNNIKGPIHQRSICPRNQRIFECP